MISFQRLSVAKEMWRRFIGGLQGAVAAARGLDRREFLRRNQGRIVRTGTGVAACAVLAGIAVLLAGSPGGQPGGAAGQPVPSSAHSAPAGQDAALRKLRDRQAKLALLSRADAESEAAIETEIGKLARFFEECKQGTRPFAEEVLGLEANLRLAGSKVENGANAVYELFGGKVERGPDRFSRYAAGCFERHVLKRADVQQAINAAYAGYRAELERIEGRLLVDLRADVDAADIGGMAALPQMKSEDLLSDSWDQAIAKAVEAASADLCVSIGKFAASWVGGDIAEKQITSPDDNGLKKFGVNVAAGAAIDKALDEGLARAGYDPAGRIAAGVAVRLDAMRDLVIEGEPKIAADLPTGALLELSGGGFLARDSDDGPLAWALDGLARDALTLAVDRLNQGTEAGLRQRLRALHGTRSDVRKAALLPEVYGPAASPAAEGADRR
jgi:hypothetical protein